MPSGHVGYLFGSSDKKLTSIRGPISSSSPHSEMSEDRPADGAKACVIQFLPGFQNPLVEVILSRAKNP